METVPVIFEYNHQKFYGFFESSQGAATEKGDSWCLMIDNYYRGKLYYSQHAGHFLYYGNSFNDMGDYFEAYMIAWHQ